MTHEVQSSAGWIVSGFQAIVILWAWVAVVLLHGLWRSVAKPDPDAIRSSRCCNQGLCDRCRRIFALPALHTTRGIRPRAWRLFRILSRTSGIQFVSETRLGGCGSPRFFRAK